MAKQRYTLVQSTHSDNWYLREARVGGYVFGSGLGVKGKCPVWPTREAAEAFAVYNGLELEPSRQDEVAKLRDELLEERRKRAELEAKCARLERNVEAAESECHELQTERNRAAAIQQQKALDEWYFARGYR
jgi:hypothetical protein